MMCLLSLASVGMAEQSRDVLYPNVWQYARSAEKEFDQIPQQRKGDLETLATFIQTQLKDNKPVNLTFICTHNSRRSHLSQIWAQVASAYYSIPHITTYSGGTKSTAFNPRAVAACKRAGLKIEKTTKGENPIYHVRYGPQKPPLTNFSKVYNNAPNPSKGFCAIMTCSSADKACPMVQGALKRIAIPFDDPKAFDGTDLEAEKYDERCRQICREMLYVFSKIQK